MSIANDDYALALHLQSIFDREIAESSSGNVTIDKGHSNGETAASIVDSSWELVDPTPDIFAMFMQFNKTYFWGKLDCVEIKWSPRMTLCAGLCRYQKRGLCSISLSQPLLKLRPRKDLVETMLHEMIHAFLFVTHNNKDRDGHGPEFLSHMNRLNKATGAKITVYHSFHDEVRSYRNHWWKCDGPCQNRPPFFGLVKRSMNRAPGPNDLWWAAHCASCEGNFKKIKEPEGYKQKVKRKKEVLVSPNITGPPEPKQMKLGNVVPFSGKGQVLGGNLKEQSPKNHRIDEYFKASGSLRSVKATSAPLQRSDDVIVIEDDSPVRKTSLSPGKFRSPRSFSQGTLDCYFSKSP